MMKWVMALILPLFPLLVHAMDDEDRLEIEQRIQPIGRVHIENQSDNLSEKDNDSNKEKIAEKKEPGQDTYEQYCITCHKDGLAGAPKFRDSTDWKPRMTGTIDDLVAIAIKGLNVMPPKGTCNECSDADLKAAIQFMLPKS